MAKSLVIVESPAKAKTINKYLGRDFKVVASMGHVRDLPKSKLGVDVDDGFQPEYVVLPDRLKVIKELKEAAKAADQIFVATDPDREGEAIGWHLAEELGGAKKKKVRRLMFNEITKKAILEAIAHPGDIDMRMVDAQQARRVLDRLVGYKISPILWDKVRRGLSAGRVQSVALKLICDREREIEDFVAEEYWHITARLRADGASTEFDARLARIGDAAAKVRNEAEARAILADLDRAEWRVTSVTNRERRRHAVPPYITSKLQQASRFPVKKTMMVAQQLYEGIQLPGEDAPIGLITYMRTDSVRVSEQALDEVRSHIRTAFGADYAPEQPNRYKLKSSAQDAHEAIRPTSMRFSPEAVRAHLTQDQFYLYRLIWNRFVASQMAPAVFDDTAVEIAARDAQSHQPFPAGDYLFRAKGSVPKFAGWLAAYGVGTGEADENERLEQPAKPAGATAEAEDEGAGGVLPPLVDGQPLDLQQLNPEQKFTQPPPRYNEGSLVKALEENGIGRPSTYASIISVLQARDYVNKVEGRFRPTVLGRRLVDRLLHPVFDDILDVEYTARMEDRLDEIEKGKADYEETLSAFYKSFEKDLKRAAKEMPNFKEGQPTGITCDKCGQGEMVEKAGKFGIFLACSRYPDCDNTKELEPAETPAEDLEGTCENCGRPMVLKRGRFGPFLACTGYPECKTTRKIIATKQGVTAAKPDQILDERCPTCGKNLVVKQGRFGEFTACTGYPECKYVKLKSTGIACPKDGGDVVERKSRRGKVFYGCANYPKCDFTLWNKPVPEPCPKCGRPFLTEKITKRHGRQLICSNEECGYVRQAELEEVTA
jgi:DNA topoisomerase-1